MLITIYISFYLTHKIIIIITIKYHLIVHLKSYSLTWNQYEIINIILFPYFIIAHHLFIKKSNKLLHKKFKPLLWLKDNNIFFLYSIKSFLLLFHQKKKKKDGNFCFLILYYQFCCAFNFCFCLILKIDKKII